MIAYVSTAVLLFDQVLDGISSEMSEVLAYVGWIFSGGQFVEITGGTDGSVNYLDLVYGDSLYETPVMPKIVFYIVPIVVLLWFGSKLAKRSAQGSTNPQAGAVAGASVAFGYAVVTLICSASIFKLSGIGGTAGPKLGSAVIIMGIIYPAVVGGVGGYLVSQR